MVRRSITPFAWVVNQGLTSLPLTDPALRARQAHEAPFLKELSDYAARTVLDIWREDVADLKPRPEFTETFR